MKTSIILIMVAMVAFVAKSQRGPAIGFVDLSFFAAFVLAIIVGFYLIYQHQKAQENEN